MPLLPDLIANPLSRIGGVAQNALEVARLGGLETGEEPAPFEVVSRQKMYRLRNYFPADPDGDGTAKASSRPAVILIPPMMLDADVYDVSPSSSAVTILHHNGIDPWVVDFGAPEREEGGSERNLTDHILAVSDAIDQVREITGRDVHLGGYSQGGMFTYQTAAYRRSEGIASLITFGSPVDTHGAMPLNLPEEFVAEVAGFLAEHIFSRGSLPAWASQLGFRLLDPVKSVRQQIEFIMQLHDREALLPREKQRRFLQGEGFVAWPGPALVDFVQQFIVHNRMLQGGFLIEGRTVTLADITLPVLSFVGEIDEIAPPKAVRAIANAAPGARIHEYTLKAGHFGLVVGSKSSEFTWPAVAAWASAVEAGETDDLPDTFERIEPGVIEEEPDAADFNDRLRIGFESVAGLSFGFARSLLRATGRTAGNVRELTAEATSQLPRLNRLERVDSRTRISLGLLLDEQADRRPEADFFLFEDRAYTRAAVKYRIDSVTRGLISLGVRQGERVGVLMAARPSGLSLVAALNRLGAVAVLMRPDGPVEQEAALGRVTRIVADPELAERALDAGIEQVLVLGGGASPRDLGDRVVDMERIDPEQVELPGWYKPNPGRAGDLAFIMFTGSPRNTRAKMISNGRWVLSAFGTASSAALDDSDTVYSVTPIYHPSGLLMSMGGAVAAGSRLAVAGSFEPEAFWQEVRRYGATVASYTWTLLHDQIEGPPQPGEVSHSIRLFMGSGMPQGLWRRANKRFAPAKVLEFYASTEGDAVLVNLGGSKPGCKGRPLPGSTDVVIAAYDMETGGLRLGEDGLAIVADDGETGMLLARARHDIGLYGSDILRGVFEPDDAWLSTGDLFQRDSDGDYWLVDHALALVRTSRGPVPAMPIQEVLSDTQQISLAVAYGVNVGEGVRPRQLAVAAVTVREGEKLKGSHIDGALSHLDADRRPDIVHIVKKIPVTTWYRPITSGFREDGVPKASRTDAFYPDPKTGKYRPLTQAAREKLIADAKAA